MKVFLLGGHDLEMQEIMKMLTREGIIFFDRGLAWDNACLSAYAGELRQYGNCTDVEVYGIELLDDMEVEKYTNYFPIDHHNQFCDRSASLQQVAAILGIPLTREQLLVAANDAGYISEMLAVGATKRKVEEIRRRDRTAQGITENDEILAQKALDENQIVIEDLIIVRAFSSRFSPICDRLWPYEKLLVYTGETLCYYGKVKAGLVNAFQQELQQHRMYHGGGEDGFLGTVKGEYNTVEIQNLRDRIKDIVLKS